jgi:hypothetical protein
VELNAKLPVRMRENEKEETRSKSLTFDFLPGFALSYAFFQSSSLMCEQLSFQETPRLTFEVRRRVGRRFGANNICHHRSRRKMADHADHVGEAWIAKG